MIHKTAVIDPAATIHPTAIIGPYCVVGAHVEIGEETELKSHVVVEGPTIIGKRNKIFPFSCLGEDPQDLKYENESSLLFIGDDNIIREHTNIHRGTQGGGNKTVLGNGNLIMSLVHIGHDCILGDNVIVASCTGLAGHVVVEDRANIGGMVGVRQFVKIGTSTYVCGYSRVDKDVPPFSICAGLEKMYVRGVNIIGLKRQGFSHERIVLLRKVFDELFSLNAPLKARLESISTEWKKDSAVSYLIDFISSSEKGIITEYEKTSAP